MFKDGEFYYMVLGAKVKNDLGYVILYKSLDLINWQLHSVPSYAPKTFYDNKGRCILIGRMGLPDIDEYYSNATIENRC